MEHSEIFWSLFAVDMNSILRQQAPDTWESFPLFQVLNNYLRLDGERNDVTSDSLLKRSFVGNDGREYVRRSIPHSPEGLVCSSSRPLYRSDGVIDRAVTASWV